jgi:hypothetical protein
MQQLKNKAYSIGLNSKIKVTSVLLSDKAIFFLNSSNLCFVFGLKGVFILPITVFKLE